MANWFTRALDTITPWDRGGEIERRKKRQDEERAREQNQPPTRSINATRGSAPPGVTYDDPLRPQRPKNIFETLNTNLNLGNQPNNVVSVVKTPDTQVTPPPQPGTIIKPQQSLINKFRDVFDANTEADKYRRSLRESELIKRDLISRGVHPAQAAQSADKIAVSGSDVPYRSSFDRATEPITRFTRGVSMLPSALARTATGAVEGAADLGKYGVTAVNAPIQLLRHGTVRGASNNWVNNATGTIQDRLFDPLNRSIDVSAEAIGGKNNMPVYKGAQIGANIIALATGLGEAANASKAGKIAEDAPRLQRILDIVGRQLGPSEDASGLVSRAANPIMKALDAIVNKPLKSTISGVRRLTGLGREAEIGGELPARIPVKKDIPIDEVVDEGANIPVKVNTPERPRGPVIREVGGDARTITTDEEAAQKAINVRRVEAAKKADQVVKPDTSVEGVTRPTTKTVIGNAEGVTQAEIDAERTMLDDALKNKEINKTQHKAANEALDKTVPINNPALAPTETPGQGRPITVKEVQGIDVADQTVVPQGLPEKPGTVRPTKATAPSNAKAEAVAAQQASEAPARVTKDVSSKTAPAATETLPTAGETDEVFLKRIANDTQTNIQRAVDSLKIQKKMTKADRAQQAAAGQTAYKNAKAAGLSQNEAEAARKTAMAGKFDRMEYKGSPIHSDDEKKIIDMVDEHYKDMPFQAGNVREAFNKLFHSGEPGAWASKEGNHIVPSDIKNVRKFLNEMVPGADGEPGLGDLAGSAVDDLAATEAGPGRIAKAIGLQRAIKFTADISATGRQGLPAGLSHPIDVFAPAIKKSFEVMFSHEKYQKLVNELRSSKIANYANDELGAHISLISDPINQADDIYRNSEWASKIPGIKQVVGASERQYNTLLSMMRLKSAERFINDAGGIANLEKAASDSPDPETFKKAIGLVSNVNTGRGQVGNLGADGSKILSNILVSPRGLAAKLQRLDFRPKNGYYAKLQKANPAAFKEAVRSLVIQTGVTAGVLGVAARTGVYEDGQIKIGNTRYDITGGASNILRTAVRMEQMMTGHRESTYGKGAEDEFWKWGKNQLAPAIASLRYIVGTKPGKDGGRVDAFGNPVDAGQFALDNATPVGASQFFQDAESGTSPTQVGVNSGLNAVGIGVNTYQSAADKKAAAEGGDVAKGSQLDTNDYASFKAQAPKEGFNLQQLDDGSYAYSINGDPHQAASLKKAREEIAKAGFDESDSNSKVVGDKYYYKDENGDTKKMPKYKHEFDVADSQNQLDMYIAKEDEDVGSWMEAANKQLKALETVRDKFNQDSQEDKVDDYQKKIETLRHDMAKYKAYGGFKKGRGGGGRKLDTSFGTLGNSFGPKVQQYESIDSKSGSIPIIRRTRPNIVHKITSSG